MPKTKKTKKTRWLKRKQRFNNLHTGIFGLVFAIAGLALLLIVLAADDQVYWNGDYETGNLSEYSGLQTKPGGVSVITSPVRSGNFAGRFFIKQGDQPIKNGHGERAETLVSRAETRGTEGAETWYGWSTYFPSEFRASKAHNGSVLFTQWHSGPSGEPDGCGPPLTFSINAWDQPEELIRARARGGPLVRTVPPCGKGVRLSDNNWNLGVLQRNKWYDFVLHIKWSADAGQGFVEIWLDGTQVVPKTSMATLYPDGYVYMKQGIYRPESYSEPSLLYHDGTRIGNSFTAVNPAAPLDGNLPPPPGGGSPPPVIEDDIGGESNYVGETSTDSQSSANSIGPSTTSSSSSGQSQTGPTPPTTDPSVPTPETNSAQDDSILTSSSTTSASESGDEAIDRLYDLAKLILATIASVLTATALFVSFKAIYRRWRT